MVELELGKGLRVVEISTAGSGSSSLSPGSLREFDPVGPRSSTPSDLLSRP